MRLEKEDSFGRSQSLSPLLADRVLARLGFSARPEPNLDSLKTIYHAWCRSVPFDNVMWLLYLASENPGPLPGHNPNDFFNNWLAFGTGGLCFPAAIAMHSLLSEVGFTVAPVRGWMPDASHATLVVDCDGTNYLVDQSVPHSEPIPLIAGSRMATPGWGMRVFHEQRRWYFRWKTFRTAGVEEIACCFETEHFKRPEVEETLSQMFVDYSGCKDWSKYNYNLNATIFRGDVLIRLVEGQREIFIDKDVNVIQHPISQSERNELLVNTFGINEELVNQLPADRPTVSLQNFRETNSRARV